MQVDIDVTGEKRIEEQYKNFIKTDSLVKTLLISEPAQIETWVDNNINGVADARVLFKKILIILRFLIRREITQ